MPAVDLSSYAAGLGQRAQAARAADAAWQAESRALARRVSELLVAQFGAQRVWLFGSVARSEAVVGSDLDLLVDGIAAERWFEACDAAGRLAGRVPVDLVPWAQCRPWIRERALAEGEALYG